MTDWIDLSARASFASHRLVGWITGMPAARERRTPEGSTT